jgi:hypothetical protein
LRLKWIALKGQGGRVLNFKENIYKTRVIGKKYLRISEEILRKYKEKY